MNQKEREFLFKTYRLQLIIVIFQLIILSAAVANEPLCTISDTDWSLLKRSDREQMLRGFFAASAQESCVCVFAQRLLESGKRNVDGALKGVIIDYLQNRDFTLELLFCLGRIEQLKENRALKDTVVNLWIASNPSYKTILYDLVNNGKLRTADTLFSILDFNGVLEEHDLLRWARVLGIMNRQDESASLYCRVIDIQPRLTHIALSQMLQLLKDSDSETVVKTLGSFRKCALLGSGVDTSIIRNWLADTYLRKGLFDKELETLLALETDSLSSGSRLAQSARHHFAHNRYRIAIQFALVAYDRFEESEQRFSLAAILYQSYIHIPVRDSALLWLKQVDFSKSEHKQSAVALYQETGHLQGAQTLLDSMDNSLERDTLFVRQYLFSGEIKKAVDAANTESVYWERNPKESALWRGRTNLFASKVQEAAEAFGSIKYSSSWPCMEEVLNYRYSIRRLEDSPGDLKKWSLLRYYLFVGELHKSAALLESISHASPYLQLLTVQVAKEFIRSRDYFSALEIMDEKFLDNPSPEFLYYRAEALYNVGSGEESQMLLQKILMEHPMDIYSQKARMLLSDMRVSG